MAVGTGSLNLKWGHLIIEELIRNSVDYYCLSPGSRCTPLSYAVATNKRAVSRLHFDERGAAFHGLGYARASGRPAALVCTSGTAAANYLPAIVEASADMVPMVVLTADRPPELRDCGANQAIDQVGLFGKYVRWQVDMPCPDESISPEFVLTTIDQAIYRAMRPPAGPVHINCMFREPFLSDDPPTLPFFGDEAGERWLQGREPFTGHTLPKSIIDPDRLHELASLLNRTSTGLLVVGALKNATQRVAVQRLSVKLGWPVLPDVASGLRLGFEGPNTITYYDLLLSSGVFDRAGRPEVVLHVGDRMVSRRLPAFLSELSPHRYIMVADHPRRYDFVHRVTERLESDLVSFCDSIVSGIETQQDRRFVEALKRASNVAAETLRANLDETENLTEPSCARLICRNLADNSGLFLANSMPVRDMDVFADTGGAAASVACNRGASGIDGTVASAAGFAVGLDRPITLLVGDLALLHDLNSLAILKTVAEPVVAVVINNNGGGIFSFLPIACQAGVFEPFFGAPHDLTFEKAAAMFGLDYHHPRTASEFASCYRQAQAAGRHTLIEVTTDRSENLTLHNDILRQVNKALARF